MQPLNFTDWRKTHPFIEDYIFYPEGKSRWARIVVPWHECVQNEQGQNIKDIYHKCAFCLDLFTGNVYLDCRKRKIWAKCAAVTINTPLIGLTKTLYHLALPFSVPIEIFQTIRAGLQQEHSKKQITYEVLRDVGRSVADVIRTPLYTVALTIVALAAVCIGIFVPYQLYQFRSSFEYLENALNWNKRGLSWNMVPCFHLLSNVMCIDKAYPYTKPDTLYDQNPTLKGFNNLARSNVKFRRRGYNIFNDCCLKLNPHKPYVSAACDPAWQIPV